MKFPMHAYIVTYMFYTHVLRVYLFIYATLLVTFLRVIVGEANVTLKDAIFQASSPLRHAIDLLAMNTNVNRKHGAFVLACTDGGPDYNISFLNVMIFWLRYFILSKCDFLIVARRTALTQSWTTHAERLMSILNLALSNCVYPEKL